MFRTKWWGVKVISADKRSVWTSGAKNITVYLNLTRLCGRFWPSWPILPLINKIKIVFDIGWSSAISAWDCHLIHDDGIGLLSTAATKCLHWSLFCQKILSENFRTNFPSTFCKRTSFQSAFFNKDEFSLGPVFIEQNRVLRWDQKVCSRIVWYARKHFQQAR